MHIPDGFLDTKTALSTYALASAGLGYALYQSKRDLPPRSIPLLGLGSAFLFAAQMINFPIAGGTSGHLIGSALMTAILGAPAAAIVVTTVLIAQCFLFADGGLTALGANVFNMAIVAPTISMLVLGLLRRLFKGTRGEIIALCLAAWFSTLAAALCCAGQLAWSGTVAWNLAFPAMAGIHMLIGLGEAALSCIVLATILKLRPETLDKTRGQTYRLGNFVVQGLLASLGIALFVSPFACEWPDGLEAVAARLGFEHKAAQDSPSWFSDYRFPGVDSPALSTALAGVVGTLAALALALALARMLVKPTANKALETET